MELYTSCNAHVYSGAPVEGRDSTGSTCSTHFAYLMQADKAVYTLTYKEPCCSNEFIRHFDHPKLSCKPC